VEGHFAQLRNTDTFNIPVAVVGDKVTDAGNSMGMLASGYWVSFGQTDNPNGGGRVDWPRQAPTVKKINRSTLLKFLHAQFGPEAQPKRTLPEARARVSASAYAPGGASCSEAPPRFVLERASRGVAETASIIRQEQR
jgi:hypothetical protein